MGLRGQLAGPGLVRHFLALFDVIPERHHGREQGAGTAPDHPVDPDSRSRQRLDHADARAHLTLPEPMTSETVGLNGAFMRHQNLLPHPPPPDMS
jgi:hypothetical protein